MGGVVAQLHHLPALVGQVQLRVEGAHRLVGDLHEESVGKEGRGKKVVDMSARKGGLSDEACCCVRRRREEEEEEEE